jgi:hypothetical protein
MTTEDLAQHFTPACAVDLLYALVEHLHGPLRAPRVIDPACGEGALLLGALRNGLTRPDRILGIERDPDTARRCLAAQPGPRFAVADALTGLTAPGAPGSFDLVVANPPYGTGAAGLRQASPEALERLLVTYGLWAVPARTRRGIATGRLRSYPAEMLFLELCLSLARPGGHVAVILPEGVCANARYASAREWLLANVRFDAVVGLPKGTFRRTGAAAKTVVMLMTRRRPDDSHQVLLGEVGEWKKRDRPLFQDGGYSQAWSENGVCPLFQCLAWHARRPQATPALTQRLDPGYWHPQYDALLDSCALPLQPLGRFIADLTYGPIVTGVAPPDLPGGVPLVNQGQVGFCGVDLTAATHVPPDSPWLSPRSMLQPGDVVLPRSGEGSLGKHRVAVFLGDQPAGVGSFVDLIRLQGLNPFYLAAFLKSSLGRAQVSRVANGVGVPNISFDEIRNLQVPALPAKAQRALEARYRREVLPWHRRAVRRHSQVLAAGRQPDHDAEYLRCLAAAQDRWTSAIGALDAALAQS